MQSECHQLQSSLDSANMRQSKLQKLNSKVKGSSNFPMFLTLFGRMVLLNQFLLLQGQSLCNSAASARNEAT
jgi:hypothetical protein